MLRVLARIHLFILSPKEKYNIKMGIVEDRKYKGLELEFDLDITPDAEVEVILDRNSGHGMKGKVMALYFKINTLGKFNMGEISKPMKEPIILNMVG
jgi:hypothetical protein